MAEIDVQAILADVKRQIEDLRLSGRYPPGLEAELEAEFREIMALTKLINLGRLDKVDEQLGNVQASLAALSSPARTDSRALLGRAVHSVINRIVGRPFSDISKRAAHAIEQLVAAQSLIVEELRSRDGVEDHVANAMAKHVLERVAVVEHLAILIVELEARVRALETGHH
jgi:hypothetical protein